MAATKNLIIDAIDDTIKAIEKENNIEILDYLEMFNYLQNAIFSENKRDTRQMLKLLKKYKYNNSYEFLKEFLGG